MAFDAGDPANILHAYQRKLLPGESARSVSFLLQKRFLSGAQVSVSIVALHISSL